MHLALAAVLARHGMGAAIAEQHAFLRVLQVRGLSIYLDIYLSRANPTTSSFWPSSPR
jgi:hypothetical protein